MMMFVIAAALLATGGALGTPWLTDLFNPGGNVSHADEAGIACPQGIVGLALVSDGEVESHGSVFTLECTYVLPPDTESAARVSVSWTETAPVDVLQRGCGLPPSTSPGVFSVEGSHYGVVGQARADYEGRTRYANAMRKLASDLVVAAASVAEPCPSHAIVTNPDVSGEPGEGGIGSSGSGSSGGSGSGDGGQGSNGQSGVGGSGDAGGVSGSDPTGEIGSDGGPAAVGTPVVAADIPFGQCVVRGRVTDSRGLAVPNIRLEVHDVTNSLVASAATEASGAYGFALPVDAAGEVVLVPTDGGREQPVFRIFAQQADVALSRQLTADQIVEGVCEVNFDIWDLDGTYESSDMRVERWPAIVDIYQSMNSAVQLAVQTDAPLDYGLPIPVYAWCDSPTLFCDPAGEAEFAFYSGTTVGRPVDQPYMALGFPSSELDYRGSPDNREYHEFGHAFLADVSGDQVPINVGDQNHGGYYRNKMTTDSFVEGFAEFYSVMVSKHIDQEENPQRYKIGAEYDIEADRKPWEAVGWWEEFTLAGLLLDFEDGPGDYVAGESSIGVESVSSLEAETGNFAIGRVRNTGTKVARSPEVTIELLNASGDPVFTQVTTVKPESLGPGQTGVFYVAAPDGVDFSNVSAVPGRPASGDDDSIDIDYVDLMRTITGDWGETDVAVTNVLELYQRLSETYAGADLDGDSIIDITQAQIDDIFINHGFFDDLDGDRAYSAATDGQVGGTAHPEAVVSQRTFPAMIPRSSAVGYVGSFVDIQTGDVDSDLLVQVELGDSDRSYAYWTRSGTDAPVELAVPEADARDAHVTVIATSDGHDPAVAYRASARQFHAAVESGEIETQPPRSEVQLEEGEPFAVLGAPTDGGFSAGEDPSSAGAPPWTMIVPVALAILMLGAGFYLMRRTTTPVAGSRKS